MNFDYKNILIFGYSKSGKAVEAVLKDIGANYKIYDKNIKIQGGKYILKLTKKILKTFNLIVLSPGVSIYNKYVKMADDMRIKIISELEFGFWFTSAEIIAVTGTNGKTTTTKLITDVLQNAGFRAEAFGNIGTPLSSAYKMQLDYIVCEVSSFQLEATDKFAPKITVLLNITEDHIDRHKTFKNYIEVKKSIFKNSNTTDYAVIGNINAVCGNIAHEIVLKVLTFGNDKANFTFADNKIFFNGEKIFDVKKKMLEYTYIDNILAVFAVMSILNIKYEVFDKCNFSEKGPHRMEYFLKHGGVTYVDDSKATNPDSVLKAVQSIKGNIVLLLGGQNKKMGFKFFAENLPKNVVSIYTFGQNGKQIHRALGRAKRTSVCCKDLYVATKLAVSKAQKGDVVLLSPACASFDEFNNYGERGDCFQDIVKKVINND